jgi:lipoprotein signal peptidase
MKKRIFYAPLIISFVVLLDQMTKYLVRTSVHPLETIELFLF